MPQPSTTQKTLTLFKGHLALAAPSQLEAFVDCVLKVRRSDFMKTMAPQ
jgi:hypothetical protein